MKFFKQKIFDLFENFLWGGAVFCDLPLLLFTETRVRSQQQGEVLD
jgi:hypothetical protein